MYFVKWLGGVGLACLLAPAASSQWLDEFDSYTPGSGLAAQSLWEEWTGSSGVDAMVDNAQSFTPQNSVLIVQNNDVVYDFANLSAGRPNSGVWTASIKTYVPLGATGQGWYILMNDYPTNLDWAVQTVFDCNAGVVMDGSASRKIRFGRWASLVISIDLDNNRYDSWYDNHPLVVNASWTSASGNMEIAALDLYGDSGGLSGLWHDNARLEKTAGGPLALTSNPNPVGANFNLEIYSNSPLLAAGDIGVLFNWTLNGSPLIVPLMYPVFDATGTWSLKVSVPAGLSGIEAGLKMFALTLTSTKTLLVSNEDVIIFQ
jgi:hypothetical protein